MELMRTWGPSTKRKSSNRRPPLVISGPVLHGEEPHALQMLQCTPISQLEHSLQQTDGETSPVSPTSDCKDQSTVSVSPSTETMVPVGKESVCRKHLTGSKRSSMYLEDMELPSQGKRTEGQSQFGRNQFRSYENLLVHIPKDHKPGTFPKALSIESLVPSPDDGKNGPQSHAQTSHPAMAWGGPGLVNRCPSPPALELRGAAG
ncbi:StAR-related lipid transfer protein 13 [Dissostichus eleginoides]|uniref:StAR-related lipid transfer protein 13 n=1 Tax=Dissostichus eleginoides TaxID=100907 RepID=A0AAD9BGQ0_DISEL|nr:StAR-related lipid transfer protein 13 [Dissostichus eleginoides]